MKVVFGQSTAILDKWIIYLLFMTQIISRVIFYKLTVCKRKTIGSRFSLILIPILHDTDEEKQQPGHAIHLIVINQPRSLLHT